MKGDLLEVVNVYYCEKCNKKVFVYCIFVEFNFCRRLFREKEANVLIFLIYKILYIYCYMYCILYFCMGVLLILDCINLFLL